LRYSCDMAIMDLVTFATLDGAAMSDPHANPVVASCSYCGGSATASQLATWGFERSAGRVRYLCPACVRAALPQIETFLSH
jgi:hypothetical protein